MSTSGYATVMNRGYAIMSENDFGDNCTTNACREFPYVNCAKRCDAQCERMRFPQTAKYDYSFARAGCLSGMSGSCGCAATRSLYFKRYGGCGCTQ
jgi:hypothetical protein